MGVWQERDEDGCKTEEMKMAVTGERKMKIGGRGEKDEEGCKTG